MQNQYSKVNSFTRSPCPQQIIIYLASALEVAIFYALIQPAISNQHTRISLIIIYSCSLIAKIVSAIIVSNIDPSDELMILSRSQKQPDKSARLAKMKRQLDNRYLFCRECLTFVTESSKHCRKCNRCVEDFDHHCTWINNCVGKKNYNVQIQMFVFIVSSGILTAEKGWKSDIISVEKMVAVWVTLGMVCIFCLLNLNLIVLHIYLICKGITTYQWIFSNEIDKLKSTKRQDTLQNLDCNRKTDNKVYPTMDGQNEEWTNPKVMYGKNKKRQFTDDFTVIHRNGKNDKSQEQGNQETVEKNNNNASYLQQIEVPDIRNQQVDNKDELYNSGFIAHFSSNSGIQDIEIQQDPFMGRTKSTKKQPLKSKHKKQQIQSHQVIRKNIKQLRGHGQVIKIASFSHLQSNKNGKKKSFHNLFASLDVGNPITTIEFEMGRNEEPKNSNHGILYKMQSKFK